MHRDFCGEGYSKSFAALEAPNNLETRNTWSNHFQYQKKLFHQNYWGNLLLHKKHEPSQLLDPQYIFEHGQKYEYFQVGIVQVGVKALNSQHDDIGSTSILLCLRDKRILDFNVSLLSVLQSSLADGPVHFNYYPNLKVSLQDKILWMF